MKILIKNRKGQKVVIVTEGPDQARCLVFVEHGLGGNKDQPHIRAMIAAFLEKGFKVISFDTTSSFGESDGLYEDASISGSIEDLEDVINWSNSQTWYREPFFLCGHSMGSISIAYFAERHPEKVFALAPISAVVSGKLSLDTYKMFNREKELEEWEKTGISITKSYDGKRIKKLKWSHIEDRLKYDLLPDVKKLTMPTILIVGERDTSTPFEHQKILYDKLPGQKELHVIKGALHSFYEPHEQQELKNLLKKWLCKITC